ncbi:MAG: MBL fold metallo-hydrolase, partial [Muribaculaceae bacterium]|nr:MBL fold metallo-hydrolase [Muribaculaceae bacterium]
MQVAIFQFSLFGINTYVVFDPATDKCAIIDPGMVNVREQDAIRKFIEAKTLEVTHIINTHLHVDHSIGNTWYLNTLGAAVLAHKDDEV